MALTAIGSVRSCGVTTLALSLAATWPAERRVAAGRARSGGWHPGSGVRVAGGAESGVAGRRSSARWPTRSWCGSTASRCQAGAAVLAGPPSSEHARRALAMLDELTRRLGELAADVFVDCGRLDPASPTSAVLDGADLVLLAVRPRLADLHALSAWLDGHPIEAKARGLVAIGDGPYPDAEIAEALGIEVVARMPWDPVAAQALASAPADSRELRLAPLARAARSLGDRLAADLDPAVRTPVGQAATAESSVALRRRLFRTWRPGRADASPSTNGAAPEEVSG